jgi:hypothetical protein
MRRIRVRSPRRRWTVQLLPRAREWPGGRTLLHGLARSAQTRLPIPLHAERIGKRTFPGSKGPTIDAIASIAAVACPGGPGCNGSGGGRSRCGGGRRSGELSREPGLRVFVAKRTGQVRNGVL